MRRRTLLLLSPLPPLIFVAALVALSPGQSGKEAANDGGQVSLSNLPITRVVMFTSGVAYIQRQGEVEGNATIDLTFPVGNINDMLKSLVVRDLNGGHVHAVSYDSADPVDKTLRSFAINLSDNPSFGQILNRARGEKVEVTWRRDGAKGTTTTSGTIIGVERQKQPAGKDKEVVEIELLNLLTAEGMVSIRLSDIGQVRFQNPQLDSEFRRALEVVARSHDTQRKTVRLTFHGKGKRTVQVGYIAEHPVWRTSYRLVMNGQDKPHLQGWAQVENPTDEDWSNVRVSLVSGRPISFRMNLYEPLYVERPWVELPLFGNLRPRTHDSGGPGGLPGFPPVSKDEKLFHPEEDFSKDKGGGGRSAVRDEYKSTVGIVVKAEKMGDFFQYTLDQPMSVPRHKSALLPIINTAVEGSRVSIYNEKQHAIHPMLGLKLKNTTGLHLMQGPVTVYDEGGYAGDALIKDVQPNEERLLSYAVDLGMEVIAEGPKDEQQLVSLKIIRGTLQRSIKLRHSRTYLVRNRTGQERTLLVEHPTHGAGYELLTKDVAAEKLRDGYRFEVKVKQDGVKLHVAEEKSVREDVVLTNIDDQTIAIVLQSPAASKELKAALQKAVELKGKWTATERQIGDVERKLDAAMKDQARARENLKVIPQTDPAYRKVLDRLLALEEEIDRQRGQREKLQTTAAQQREEYERYLTELTVKE